MFERILELIGETELEKLKKANVLLVGLGGVGGITLETLVRCGIGHITIIDHDTFEKSNLNRQILSLDSNIGQKKVLVAKNRMLDINPNLDITALDIFLDKSNIDMLGDYDYIIDACDTVKTKVLLIKYALEKNIKIISSMGMGNRIDPRNIEITKLNRTINDPLAKKLRNLLKDESLPLNIPVVCSGDLPMKRDKHISSMIMVPASAGIYMAYYVVNDILDIEQ